MLIEKFIEYLKIEKNYSVNTLSAYKKDLIEFQVFINENFDKCVIENVDYKIIRSWIVLLVNKNLSNRSINRKVSSLKSFYKFLVKTETINSSPLIAHSPLKQSKKIHADDPSNECKEGDIVTIEETKPISKTKAWKLASVDRQAVIIG